MLAYFKHTATPITKYPTAKNTAPTFILYLRTPRTGFNKSIKLITHSTNITEYTNKDIVTEFYPSTVIIMSN